MLLSMPMSIISIYSIYLPYKTRQGQIVKSFPEHISLSCSYLNISPIYMVTIQYVQHIPSIKPCIYSINFDSIWPFLKFHIFLFNLFVVKILYLQVLYFMSFKIYIYFFLQILIYYFCISKTSIFNIYYFHNVVLSKFHNCEILVSQLFMIKFFFFYYFWFCYFTICILTTF